MSNDPQIMLNKLKGKTAKPNAQPNVPQIKTTEELAKQSQETGRWNESLLSVTKNLVREGRSDAEIHAVTDKLTTSDYTVEDTRKQVQPMIDGARSKPLGKFHPNAANTHKAQDFPVVCAPGSLVAICAIRLHQAGEV